MKKIKSFNKFVKSNFNPKPSKKTYGWMPDPKVKVTKVKEEIDIRKGLIGAGLATSLLGTSPQLKANTNTLTQQSTSESERIEQYTNKVSELRKEELENKDPELNSILQELSSNSTSTDSTKYLELYSKLTAHIEEKYGYRIEKKYPEEKFQSGKFDTSGMTLFEVMGWLGSICLAICGLPQAWQSFRDKHSEGISWGFLLLWAFGEIFALAYVYDKLDLPLLLNYATNILILAVILYYKINPKNTTEYDKEVRRFH